MLDPGWDKISAGAKEFLTKLLQYLPENRPSASEALQDPWMLKFIGSKGVSEEEMQKCMNNLRSFRTQMTFQKAVLAYIASQELTKDEEKQIKCAFEALDTDKNGSITKDELVRGYILAFGKEAEAPAEAERILRRLDVNQNGSIDYNGT